MRLYELREGFTIHPGHTSDEPDVIGYTSKGKDDPFFSDIAKSAGYKPITKSTLKDVRASSAEIEELEPYIQQNPNSYQKNISVYTAMPVFKTSEAHKSGKYRTFMDALKGKKSDAIFSERGKEALLNDSAKRVFVYFLSDNQTILNRVNNIILAPVPSGSNLAKEFTKKVAEEFKQKLGIASGKVQVELNLFQKAELPKHSSIRRAHKAGEKIRSEYSYPFPPRKHSFNIPPLKAFATDIAAAWARGHISDEQIEKEIYNLKARATRKLSELKKQLHTVTDNEQRADIEEQLNAYQQKLDYLEKSFGADIEHEQERATSSENKSRQREPGEIKALHGMTRGTTYDRFTTKRTEPFSGRTLLIIVDDNIDEGKSITDLYRTLFKKGFVDQRTTRVVAFALQRVQS